ncbi:hypothetical protein [Pseudomonas gingeri]
MSKQDTAFCSLLNKIAQGKNEIREPAEVDTLEQLISFDYAQAVAHVGTQQLAYSDVRMTAMGSAFLSVCNAAQHPVR